MSEVSNDAVLYRDYNVQQLISLYVRLRQALRDADARHKEKTQPSRDELVRIEGAMLARLQESNIDSIKCAAGTMYRSHRKSATLADPAAFKEFVIASNKWELADWKANATAVADYINDHSGVVPPGVNYSVIYTVGVRTGKGESNGE